MNDYELRLLDPLTDQSLFRTAYSWRNPKRHTQPDRMPYEVFASDHPTHLAIGLFNGELQAVYFLHEVEPTVYQAHFTSRRNVSREALLEGARRVADAVLSNGGSEIHGWVTPRNGPLRSFLTALGFTETVRETFPCQNDTDGAKLANESRNQRREFVKYVLKATSIGPLRQETGIETDQPNGEHLRLSERS